MADVKIMTGTCGAIRFDLWGEGKLQGPHLHLNVLMHENIGQEKIMSNTVLNV